MAVDVYQSIALIYGNEIVFGSSCRIIRVLKYYRDTGDQKLAASAGIFDVTDLYGSVYLDVCDESVRP